MNTYKRSFLVALAASLLPACGGSGADTPVTVSFYGDSVTTGTHSADYDVWLPERWSPTPVEVISGLTGTAALDYSKDGASALGASIHDDGSHISVIRFGVADTVYGTFPDVFAAHIQRLVKESQVLYQLALLVGLTHTMDGRAKTLDAVVRRCAADLRVPFVDVHALPFHGRSDMADAIHPGACYSRRASHAIAASINETLWDSR